MTGQADTIKNREQWLEEHRKIENYILIYGCGLICFLKKFRKSAGLFEDVANYTIN